MILPVILVSVVCHATPEATREYKIKAAIMFNLLKFVEWPVSDPGQDGSEMSICILGEDPFDDAFTPIEGAELQGKTLAIKRLSEIKDVESCNLLFISVSEKDHVTKILDKVKETTVLTVSELDGFMDIGGMVNFILEENKVNFSINLEAAEKAGLTIRSKLLRLAKEVKQ